MSANQSRLDLLIDVFDQPAQRAMARPSLRPGELVAAVIDEFRELEYLGGDAARYQLVSATTRAALAEDVPIGQQAKAGDHLALIERDLSLPPGTQRFSHPIYLREQESGAVYKLDWQPAIIGRPDTTRQDNDQIAIDLSAHPAGQRVSRRHAQIVEVNGQFYAEHLAQNPTVVKSSAGMTTRVERDRLPIQDGDVLVLENSQIQLKVLVPQEPAA